MSNTAINIEHLSKKYRLGVINNGTLFRDIQTWVALKRGKEDPHSKIGENKYATTDDYFWALKDISFDIKQGDRVGIIGQNGAGKSTLLKILSRITTPTEGSIKIKGKVASLLEVGTGFHGELTGRENIYLNGAILGMKKRRIDQKFDEIVEFSGIEHHIDTPVKRYSSGMYVRLAFAVAAHLDSDILIADEVLAVGDIEFQKKALGKMQDLSTGEGRTVLFVSHNMGAVNSLCNLGVILYQGTIVQQNTIDIITKNYISMINNKANSTTMPSYWEGSVGDSDLKFYKAEISKNKDIHKISMSYEIFSPNNNYCFSIFFNNEYGHAISTIAISNYVSDENYKQLCSAGVHQINVFFNASIFEIGKYNINFDFAIYCVKRITPPDIRIYFDIFNPESHRHPSGFFENITKPNWNLEIVN